MVPCSSAMLVDTHCHLADPAYDADRAEVLRRAWAAGLAHVVVIGESPAACDRALALAAEDDRLSVTAGIHPHDARTWARSTDGIGARKFGTSEALERLVSV